MIAIHGVLTEQQKSKQWVIYSFSIRPGRFKCGYAERCNISPSENISLFSWCVLIFLESLTWFSFNWGDTSNVWSTVVSQGPLRSMNCKYYEYTSSKAVDPKMDSTVLPGAVTLKKSGAIIGYPKGNDGCKNKQDNGLIGLSFICEIYLFWICCRKLPVYVGVSVCRGEGWECCPNVKVSEQLEKV